MPGQASVIDAAGTCCTLTRLKASEAKETLGIFLAPLTGISERRQVEKLKTENGSLCGMCENGLFKPCRFVVCP